MKWRWFLILLVLSVCTNAHAAKKWRTYEDCIMRDKRANDGDSFHVRYKSEKGNYSYYLLRLYFVDTPESDDSLPDRIKEQAEYFGLSEKETVKLGKEAAEFTSDFLKDGGFTVYTKHRDARGRSEKKRRYSMVEKDGKYLSELLVENGLARVFGVGDDLPDGTSENHYWSRLRAAERRAKDRKLGGWKKTLTRIEEMQLQVQQQAAKVQAMKEGTYGESEATQPATPAASRPAAATGEAMTPNIVPQTMTIGRPIRVFSLKDANRQVGILQAGAEVEVLGAESASMVRIRFKAGEGKVYEAQCWRTEIGL